MRGERRCRCVRTRGVHPAPASLARCAPGCWAWWGCRAPALPVGGGWVQSVRGRGSRARARNGTSTRYPPPPPPPAHVLVAEAALRLHADCHRLLVVERVPGGRGTRELGARISVRSGALGGDSLARSGSPAPRPHPPPGRRGLRAALPCRPTPPRGGLTQGAAMRSRPNSPPCRAPGRCHPTHLCSTGSGMLAWARKAVPLTRWWDRRGARASGRELAGPPLGP